MSDKDSRLRRRIRAGRVWLREKLHYFIVATLIVLLVLLFLWPRIVIVIKPGHAGVLYRPFWGGTQMDRIYHERLHIINPLNTMFIYEIRRQIVRHNMTALSIEGLPIKLSLAIRFVPIEQMLGLLHRDIGPDYLNRVVLPQTESVIRKNIGSRTAEAIYTNDNGTLANIVNRTIEEVGRNYIQIDDILIRSLELPETVKKAIDEKLVHQEILKSYVFRLQTEQQEADRKRIESAGIRDYQATITETLNDQLIKWQGVQATLQMATSTNAKIVVIGAGEEGLPVILGQ